MRERPEPPWITGLNQALPSTSTSVVAQYLTFGLVLLLLALAGWLYLNTTVRVDTLAVDIHQLELQKEELRREIVVMNAQLAMMESLERVQRDAKELGFTPRQPSQRFTVPVTDQTTLGANRPSAVADQNLWRRLWRALTGTARDEGP